MSEQVVTQRPPTEPEVWQWLVDKIAHRLGVPAQQVDVHRYFDEFDLDSTEALVLSGELESWLGFELETTALWYHPTIAELSAHIVAKRDGGGL
ncbi:acyl carrier protein [Kutzneria viridogrisea]|uniref:Acyl carrier protein n=1 Tax=Kutzneria viridogrisea TaxID=47990 RepID=A0ABR6BB50_9PSEU|nr:acyl carrier protein [Kutzneria viridogrisea]